MIISSAGCNSASEPESMVTKCCDALKTFDIETASSYFVLGDLEIENPFTDENIDEQTIEYFTNHAKEMTYVLGETVAEGDKVVIPVTFTYADVSPVISAALADFLPQAFALAFSGADNSVTEDLFYSIFMEKTEYVSTETATATVEFVCIKQDNVWKIMDFSGDVQYEISNIISCNTVKALDSFENEFK